ncbi:MAG: S1 RNA-binding domain-containing protein [Rhodocyclaceae bacterium]|nr:S1 RNA-binding domain-containing protein [Rhodocyclaceae bacterium]
MQDKLGETFAGTISGVSSFGIFVVLDEIYVDGLVHISALENDFYHFDPIGHRLIGERTGRVYRLGDRVWVQVAAVDLDERKIDFVLVKPPQSKRRRLVKAAREDSTTGSQANAEARKRRARPHLDAPEDKDGP